MKARTTLAVAIGALFVAGLLIQAPFLNGPDHWKWAWRSGPSRVPIMLLTGIPLLFAVISLEGGKKLPNPVLFLPLLCVSCFFVQLAAALVEPEGLEGIRRIVYSPLATSYFTDATEIDSLRGWLGRYNELTRGEHSATHPPGPVLYYYFWIRLLGIHSGALAGGIGLGALATLGIPAIYFLSGLWTSELRARLTACIAYAYLPALILFFPEFDQVYPVLAMTLLYAWIRALEGRLAYGIATGLALFVATFFAYNLLVLGAFMALCALLRVVTADERRRAALSVVKAAAACLVACVASYLICHVLTGFRPLETFAQAVHHQQAAAAKLHRPYVTCLYYDLYDFSLGSGMILSVLACFSVLSAARQLKERRPEPYFVLVGLATILIVDLSGLLRAETARVWLFLQPLSLLAAAIEWERQPARDRVVLWITYWTILITIKSKLLFISLG